MKKPGIRIINIALVFITAFTIVTACSHNMTTTTTGKPQATSVVDEHADTQDKVSIKVNVVDQTNTPVCDVVVSIRENGTNNSILNTTSKTGSTCFTSMSPGVYVVSVDKTPDSYQTINDVAIFRASKDSEVTIKVQRSAKQFFGTWKFYGFYDAHEGITLLLNDYEAFGNYDYSDLYLIIEEDETIAMYHNGEITKGAPYVLTKTGIGMGSTVEDCVQFSIHRDLLHVDGTDGNKMIYEKVSDSQDVEDIVPNPYVNTTLGQRNALKSALKYLNLNHGFSYNKLIEQLEYEQYTHEEAVYAADHCGADWNEQAVKSAQSYLRSSNFSRGRLIEQLEYEGFTHEQAEYAVEQVGY